MLSERPRMKELSSLPPRKDMSSDERRLRPRVLKQIFVLL